MRRSMWVEKVFCFSFVTFTPLLRGQFPWIGIGTMMNMASDYRHGIYQGREERTNQTFCGFFCMDGQSINWVNGGEDGRQVYPGGSGTTHKNILSGKVFLFSSCLQRFLRRYLSVGKATTTQHLTSSDWFFALGHSSSVMAGTHWDQDGTGQSFAFSFTSRPPG